MKQTVIGLATAAALLGCEAVTPPTSDLGENTDLVTKTFKPHLQVCSSAIPKLCLLEVTESGERFFHDPIEGFDFQWGTEYQLELLRTKTNEPPANDYRYALKSVLQEKENLAFSEFPMLTQLPLNKDSIRKEGEQFYLFSFPFSCGITGASVTINQCNDLAERAEDQRISGELVSLTFRYRGKANDGTGEIELIKID